MSDRGSVRRESVRRENVCRGSVSRGSVRESFRINIIYHIFVKNDFLIVKLNQYLAL